MSGVHGFPHSKRPILKRYIYGCDFKCRNIPWTGNRATLFFLYQTYLGTVAARLRAQESVTMEARSKSIPIPKAKAATGKARQRPRRRQKPMPRPRLRQSGAHEFPKSDVIMLPWVHPQGNHCLNNSESKIYQRTDIDYVFV